MLHKNTLHIIAQGKTYIDGEGADAEKKDAQGQRSDSDFERFEGSEIEIHGGNPAALPVNLRSGRVVRTRRMSALIFLPLARHPILCYTKSLSTKNPVAGITQARQDIAVVIELTVNRRRVDFDIRVHPAQCGNAFRAGQQA